MNKDLLVELYINQNQTLKEIGDSVGSTPANVSYWVKKYRLSRKKKQEFGSELASWIYENCYTDRGFNNRCTSFSWWQDRGFTNRYEEIHCATSWLDTDKLIERVYHIMHGSTERPVCDCGEPTSFRNISDGYYKYCSPECAAQCPERNEKIRQNTDYAAKVEVDRKRNLEKYGVESLLNLPEFQAKCRQSKLKKYGTLDANRSKNEATNLRKYGVISPLLLPEFQEKCRQSKLEKYGTLVPIINNYSSQETEVIEYLRSLGLDIKKNRSLLRDRELDGFCEDRGLAFEYCGLYWHSEAQKEDKKYHYDKYKRCKDLGIRLITIFEDEWLHKERQVKQYLKATLGIFNQRIYARNTQFAEIEPDRHFFSEYHIQGSPHRIDRCFGLLHEGELIASVSFGIHHRNNTDLVLNRLAFSDDIQIIGGASKLVRNALSVLNKNVITWSDNRWSTGDLYQKIGFVHSGSLKPDYSYVIPGERIRKSKQSMKKSNIGCPSHITERDFLFEKKIFRIWDCGKIRWEYRIKENE